MKNIFLSFVINLFCFSVLSQEKYIEKFDNGNIKIEATIIDSVFVGVYKEYYKSGKIKKQGSFKNCISEINKYSVLQTDNIGAFYKGIKKGKRDGIWMFYYESGKLETSYNYVCDIEHGLKYNYYENGKIDYIEFYQYNDLISSIKFDKEGNMLKKSSYEYLYDKKESTDIVFFKEYEYFSNGRLKKDREVQDYDSFNEKVKAIEYNDKGYMIEELNLVDDKKNGVCRFYYANGEVKSTANYVDDAPEGEKYFYDKKGKVLRVEFWKNKKLKKVNYANNKTSKR